MSRFFSQLKNPSNMLGAIVIVLLGSLVWTFAIAGGVMSRNFDGGIFLSTSAGLRHGISLYSGVWDNKDPLFFVVMSGAGAIHPVLAFILDWFWLAVASFGAYLIAKRVTSSSIAIFIGVVVTPFLLIGPAYVPGITSLPGSAALLLALGLLFHRKGVWAGVMLGILLFLKLTLFPVAIACAIVLLFFPSYRAFLKKAALTFVVACAVMFAALAISGSLSGYFSMLTRNRQYATDALTYFGFESTPFGHLARLVSGWTWGEWAALLVAGVIAVAALVRFVPKRWNSRSELRILSIWISVSYISILLVLSLTTVWEHHAQALYAIYVLSVIGFATLMAGVRPHVLILVLVAAVTLVLSGWGSPERISQAWSTRTSSFEPSLSAVSTIAPEAILLNTVPLDSFTFARLGTNDDQGFLRDAPSRAHLVCSRFHLYDFSPDADFRNAAECIKTVDVVLLTDNFVVFGNGGKAGVVRPILDYVNYAFTCIRVDANQLCQRKPGIY